MSKDSGKLASNKTEQDQVRRFYELLAYGEFSRAGEYAKSADMAGDEAEKLILASLEIKNQLQKLLS